MKTSSIDDLGTRAADAGMRGAADYLATDGLTSFRNVSDAVVETLLVEVRAEINAKLGEALDDARKAHEAGMGGFAGPTFLLTMKQAGINAAKRWRAGAGKGVRA